MGSLIDWTKELLRSSKHPAGSTQHFVDMVYIEYGKVMSEDVKYHVEKYGYQGCLEPWQIELMIDELSDQTFPGETAEFRQFVVGYFGGSISDLKFAVEGGDV